MDSAINQAIDAVIALMNDTQPFAQILRGPLQASPGIAVEPSAGQPPERHMDRRSVMRIDLVVNAKHTDRRALTNALHAIHQHLTTLRRYPRGSAWQIASIETQAHPALVERKSDRTWLYASALMVTIYM